MSFPRTLLVSSMLALAACGGTSGNSSANEPSGGAGETGAGGGAASSCTSLDACVLATASDVSTDFGAAYADGMHGVADHPSTGTAPSLSTCQFATMATGAPSVSVLVRCSPAHDNDPASVKMEATAMGFSAPMDVSGVGDSAFWATKTVTAGATSGQLNVFVGTDLYLVVTVVGATDANAALDAATKLAVTALSRAK